MRGYVVSLCDRTGNMVRPWLDAGYRALTVDLQPTPADYEFHPLHEHLSFDVRGLLTFRRSMVLGQKPTIMFAFPPCTHLAVSGARHFKSKGLKLAAEAFQIADACRELCEASGAPWMLENPVSTLSTYWREPDHIFHPWQYSAFELGDNYTKKTCLWTGGGFVMPAPSVCEDLGPPDDRIHKAPPSADRSNIRSATPMGFARAVFHANSEKETVAA